MARILFGVLLLAHGAVHIGVYAPPAGEDEPWDRDHSWLLSQLSLRKGAARQFTIWLASAVTVLFAVTAVALFADQGWWREVAVVSAALSLLLLALFFNFWLSFGMLLSAAILVSALVFDWPSAG
jgi:hypothetical protein